MATNITGFCLDWHINVSNAFKTFLVNPLLPDIQINLKAWDGINFDDSQINNGENSPLIFCQLMPPPDLLSKSPDKLIWIPMWDHIQNKNQDWWNTLPPEFRIIAYSDQIYKKATVANLRVLKVKYYPDPQKNNSEKFSKPLTALYWNRRGIFSSELIKQICYKYNIERLFFLNKPDPQTNKDLCYTLPSKFGKTNVITYSDFLPPETYKALLSKTDIYIAPRLREGVGMTVLEAMSEGCMVISFNAPTMNEYIINKKNGILLDPQKNNFLDKCYRKASQIIKLPDPYRKERKFILNRSIQLDHFSNNEITNIGKSAWNSLQFGHERWKAQVAEIKKFILE